MTELRSKIKEQRQAKGLTLHQLSLASGVSSSHLARIERGERFPSGYILQRLAKPLGLGEIELLKLAGVLPADASDQRIDRLKAELKRDIAHALVTLYRKIDSW